jgi:transcriptional regulator with XRE-family HTH domain
MHHSLVPPIQMKSQLGQDPRIKCPPLIAIQDLQYDQRHIICMTSYLTTEKPMSISASQCRAARALLDWSQDQLAENAQVARATVADFERNARVPMRNNLVSIVSTLEAAGVAFIPEHDEGAGVRFRKVELEYSNTVKTRDHDVLLSVRYRGEPFRVVIPREVTDDIDRTNYRTTEQRVKAVQSHLPIFLRAAEEAIVNGHYPSPGEVILHHDRFPAGTF